METPGPDDQGPGPTGGPQRPGGRLIRRSVQNRRTRALVAAAGIAVSTLLVLVLMGSYRALTQGVRSYAGADGIDLWVAPRGTDNLIRSSSVIPASIADSVSALPSVREVGPLLRGFVSVQVAGSSDSEPPKRANILAIGYRAPDGLGAPTRMYSGRPPGGPGVVVIDRAAAHRLEVKVSDTILVNDLRFELVGLSVGTNLMATQFAFFDMAALEQTSGFSGQHSFLAVRLESDESPTHTAAAIENSFPSVAVYTRDQFMANNVREVAAGFRPMQLLVSGMGLLAAAVLVALLVQGGVEDRRQDIAVLLALGAPAGSIAAGVVAHATILVLMGGAVGGALTMVLHIALLLWLPTVELAPRLLDLAIALPIFMAVSWLAATVPLLRLKRIDPVTAFRP